MVTNTSRTKADAYGYDLGNPNSLTLLCCRIERLCKSFISSSYYEPAV